MFSYPLNGKELFTFLGQNSMTESEFIGHVKNIVSDENCAVAERDGYYYVKPNKHFIDTRMEREALSRRMWRMAGLVTHLIKRFPFVRAVMVTGSLSKNNSDKKSDLDFMVITEKNRLWVARTLLMLFKKIFLLNSYKYFCVNYLISSEKLEIEEKNLFTATEVAYVRATHNQDLVDEFIRANKWICSYFPNYIVCDPYLHTPFCKLSVRKSYLQKFMEIFLNGKPGNRLEKYFMNVTINHWEKQYSNIDKAERTHMFKSTETVSKTHPGNMQKKILNAYSKKLQEFCL